MTLQARKRKAHSLPAFCFRKILVRQILTTGLVLSVALQHAHAQTAGERQDGEDPNDQEFKAEAPERPEDNAISSPSVCTQQTTSAPTSSRTRGD